MIDIWVATVPFLMRKVLEEKNFTVSPQRSAKSSQYFSESDEIFKSTAQLNHKLVNKSRRFIILFLLPVFDQ